MPLVSDSFPNLLNGISRQPSAVRLPTQGERQINFVPYPEEGLRDRPATQHLALLEADTWTEAFIHMINRDASERYVVVITDGDLRVFDLEGNEKTVAFPDGKTSLSSAAPRSAFRATTVADYTFIVNSGTTVAMAADTSDDNGEEALIFVKGASASTVFTISVNGSEVANHDTGSSGDDQNDIAAALATDLTSGLGAGWTVTRELHVIHVKKDDGSAFTITGGDTRSNTQVSIVKNKVNAFTDLPTLAPTDFMVKVVGDPGGNDDDYWVKFVPNNPSEDFDEGNWEETVAPGIPYTLDAATMPHVLVREGDGTFTYREQTWADRTAGDENTNPDPSFVGRKINDVFFHRNRLGFLADDNMILSEAQEFFNFFLPTVTTVADNHPIDVQTSTTKVSILRRAVQFDEDVYAISDQGRFRLDYGDVLSPETAELVLVDNYEINVGAAPVAGDKTFFFAIPKGSFGGMREVFVDTDSGLQDAADISRHVSDYLPDNIYKLAVGVNENILIALSTDETDTLYAYKYYWAGNEKKQSAWFEMSAPAGATILNADFIGTELFLVLQYADGVYLEKMQFASGYKDTGVDFEFLLDRKVDEGDCTVSYSSANKQTTFTLPYEPDEDTVKVVVRTTDADHAQGEVLNPVSVTGADVVVTGDYSSSEVFIGQSFERRYRLSPPVVRRYGPDGSSAVVATSRLQVLRMTIVFGPSRYFRVEITPEARTMTTKAFSGIILGTISSALNEVVLSEGNFSFAVNAEAGRVDIDIVNDSVFPSRFLSVDWVGKFTQKSRRLR